MTSSNLAPAYYWLHFRIICPQSTVLMGDSLISICKSFLWNHLVYAEKNPLVSFLEGFSLASNIPEARQEKGTVSFPCLCCVWCTLIHSHSCSVFLGSKPTVFWVKYVWEVTWLLLKCGGWGTTLYRHVTIVQFLVPYLSPVFCG